MCQEKLFYFKKMQCYLQMLLVLSQLANENITGSNSIEISSNSKIIVLLDSRITASLEPIFAREKFQSADLLSCIISSPNFIVSLILNLQAWY